MFRGVVPARVMWRHMCCAVPHNLMFV